MDTGIYVALSKEVGIFRDLEVTSNNIANEATSGYQSENLLFSDYLTSTTPQENKVAFANSSSAYRSTQEGTLQTTGNTLDAAIQGSGYFVVRTPLGVRYTRSGSFKVNSDGLLVSTEGYPVLDDTSQPISFDEVDRVIVIDDDGTVNVDNNPRATLKVVQFDNEQLLHRVGNTMYSTDATPRPAQDFKIADGMLERSNVNTFAMLTHLLYVTRSASDTANFISTMFTIERNASNTLAKIYT